MINIMNLDDFIRIGGEYSPLKIVKRHLWGWECEYSLSHPASNENVTATVVIYRYGGRYIISDRHFDENISFFDAVRKIYRDKVMSKPDSKENIRKNILKLICSLASMLLRTVVPAYEFIRLGIALAENDLYTATIRLMLGFMSMFAAFLVSSIRIWLLGMGAMKNSDLDVLYKKESMSYEKERAK